MQGIKFWVGSEMVGKIASFGVKRVKGFAHPSKVSANIRLFLPPFFLGGGGLLGFKFETVSFRILVTCLFNTKLLLVVIIALVRVHKDFLNNNLKQRQFLPYAS